VESHLPRPRRGGALCVAADGTRSAGPSTITFCESEEPRSTAKYATHSAGGGFASVIPSVTTRTASSSAPVALSDDTNVSPSALRTPPKQAHTLVS
jgi:hypothetical protein